jgi:hypothetical protein
MTSRRNNYLMITLSLLLLTLSACNFPGTVSEPSLDEQAATIVALTLTAAQTSTPTETPQPAANTPTLAITRTPTPSITPTYSAPLLTINEPTNCRTGPGQSYDVLFTFNAGAVVEIVGRYPTNNYWTVKVQGLEQPCWIWGEYTTASGSYWTVPSVTPPATATASPPTGPSFSNWEYLCGYGASGPNATVTLEWTDRSENESGYRVYRNDKQVTELPPNSNSFSEVIDVEEGQTITYRVEAFNDSGSSSSSTISFSCQ